MEKTYRNNLYLTIFGTNTRSGRIFDLSLVVIILLSIVVVFMDSVPSLRNSWHNLFIIAEWVITIIFTIEYILRILVVKKPWGYIFSFFGIIDLLAILPSFIGLILTGASSLIILRALRLIRIFRVLKLSRYTNAGTIINRSLKASRAKIGVFLASVLTAVIIIGTLMYLIEGETSGFTSIPRGIYWAIVTITTVGYGDIAPVTALGQFIASITMLTGYAIIAVPTGIVTAEFTNQQKIANKHGISTITCTTCQAEGHDEDAQYCSRCGARLN
jgi:voltage-gated potassium channel